MAETTTTLSPNLHSYYQKRLLEGAKKMFKFRQFGDEKLHPKGTGKDYFLLRYGHVNPSTNTLTEGVTPSATTVDTNKYTVSINEYGQYIEYSQLLQWTAIDDVQNSLVDELSYTAAHSLDQVIRDHLIANATTNIKYVGSGNTADNDITASETFTAPDVLKSVSLLSGADVRPFDDDNYIWLIHPYIGIDIMSDTSAGGFIELNKYVQGMKATEIYNGEIGKVYGARVVTSTDVSFAANAGSVNVYRTFVMGKNAYQMTKFNNDAIELIVKKPGSAGTADPLNQKGTCGYKIQFGVKYTGGSFTNHNGASPDTVLQLRGTSTNN